MIDYVDQMNDQGASIPPKLKTALNRFFRKHPSTVEGCLIRKDYGKRTIKLIIESSTLYNYLQGEFGWEIHTDFYNAFDKCGFHPEKINSCVVGFYKD